MNICFDRALAVVICVYILNIVFPLLNKFIYRYKTIKRRVPERSKPCHIRFSFVFVSPRDCGTLQTRISFWSPSQSLTSDAVWRGFPRAPCCCPGCPAGLRESSTPGAWALWPAAPPESCESLLLPPHSCAQAFYLFPNYLSVSGCVVEWTLAINNLHLNLWRVADVEAKVNLRHQNRLHLPYEVCPRCNFMAFYEVRLLEHIFA